MVPPLLTTLDEKLHVLERMDVDYAVVERFLARKRPRSTTATTSPDVLVGTLGMRHLVVGYDFHLGRGREGSQERLVEEGRRLGFAVTIVPPMVLQGSVVSSTKIRRDIIGAASRARGALSRAALFLRGGGRAGGGARARASIFRRRTPRSPTPGSSCRPAASTRSRSRRAEASTAG